MDILSKDDIEFDLKEVSNGLYILTIKCGKHPIVLWLVKSELDQLMDVINI